MTDPLVVAAELSERNYPGKCSREIWGPTETIFLSVVIFEVVFDNFGDQFGAMLADPGTSGFPNSLMEGPVALRVSHQSSVAHLGPSL